MSALELILSENEKILWHGEISKEGLNRIIAKIILLILSIVLYLVISPLTIYYLINFLFYFFLLISIIAIYRGVSSLFIFRYLLIYSDLKGLEYYIIYTYI